MNSPITFQLLRGGEPFEYFLGVLEDGGAANQGQNASELRHGEFGAYLPAGTDALRAVQFAAGGLLPPGEGQAMDGVWVEEVPNTIPAVAEHVSTVISTLAQPSLWVHEPLLNEAELVSLLSTATVRALRIDAELYLNYENGLRTKDVVAEAISFSVQSWHFLAFVTDGVHQASSVSLLVKNARMILVGAFDGESILIWQRTPWSPNKTS